MSKSRLLETVPELALANSEDFNDPSADWHISREQMANTSLALSFMIGLVPGQTFKTTSGKYIAMDYYRSKGLWVQKALETQLNMSPKHAQQLAILMERSALRAAKYNEQDWQDYYEKRNKTNPGNTSWAVSAKDMRDIVDFLKQGITINCEGCVPYYAGLSDDKKTIYFDSSIRQVFPTSLGCDISPLDFVVFHERVEGAMMEQSYLDQLRKGKSEIRFECPLPLKEENHFEKLVMRYQLDNDQLKLSYEHQESTEAEWKAITGINMNQQAIDQHVLSYGFGHQIAERLERAAIFASGFGSIWEKEYNQPVMDDINRLKKEYEEVEASKQPLPRAVPAGLYIFPYAQETDNPIEMYLLRQVAEFKLHRYAEKKPSASLSSISLFKSTEEEKNITSSTTSSTFKKT